MRFPRAAGGVQLRSSSTVLQLAAATLSLTTLTCASEDEEPAVATHAATFDGGVDGGTESELSAPLSSAPDASCTLGLHGEHEYWICTAATDWTTARDLCRAQAGMDLARIDDADENAFIQGELTDDAWIGAQDTGSDTWVWSDDGTLFWSGDWSGSPVGGLYESWDTLEPDGGQRCAFTRDSDGRWRDTDCGSSKHFVCEIAPDYCAGDPDKAGPGQCGCGAPDTDNDGDGTADCVDGCPDDPNKSALGECGCGTPDTDTDGDGTPDCFDGCDEDPTRPEPPCAPDSDCEYQTHGGSAYFFCDRHRSWTDAKAHCEESGMHLARIDDAAENDFISEQILTDRWIGGSDRADEGVWVWESDAEQFWQGEADGGPVDDLYSNWRGSQPNDLGFGEGQDCLQIEGDGDWWDDDCDETEQYICELSDQCPDDPDKTEPGACGCSVPDVDSDSDGLFDCEDPDCPAPGCIMIGASCAVDDDCAAVDGAAFCQTTFPGGYCTLACDGAADSCPGGHSCLNASHCVVDCLTDDTCLKPEHACSELDAPGGAPFCRPTCALSCSAGFRCDADQGQCVACAAADTSCDGIDDDCDAVVDEDFVGSPTSCGVGACVVTTTTSCVGGVPQESCTPGQPASNDAMCDGVDDDCDGVADEEYTSLPTSCGDGGCAATGSTGCVDGVVVDSCVEGTPAADDASCDGVDDDCDGVADEAYAQTTSTCGEGMCASTGTLSCVGGVVVDSCVVGTPAASDASCDAVDDDCDTLTDEDYVGTETSCGTGECVATGVTICVAGGVEDACVPGTAAAQDSVCDGLDEDCDGSADEDYAPETTSCGEGLCAGQGQTSCVAGEVLDDCEPLSPDDGNPCTTDSCDPETGVENAPRVEGADCGDGDLCNGAELCASCQQAPADALALWSGQDHALDLVGGQDGTASGGVAFVPGVSGKAFRFDGVDDGVVATVPMAGATEATMEAWIRTEVTPQGVSCFVSIPDNSASGTHSMELCAESARVRMCAAGVCSTAVAPIADGQWHHVLGSWDGATATIYWDGGSVHSFAASGALTTDQDELNIGRFGQFDGWRWNGDVDEVVLHDRALSAAEALAAYELGGAHGCDTSECLGGEVVRVTDGLDCTADTCDPETGEVTHTVAPGADCDDRDPCTVGDACDAAGQCTVSTPVDVDDGNECTVDSCSPFSGVSHVITPGAACGEGGVGICDVVGTCVFEVCDDGADNDSDGNTDCDDADCVTSDLCPNDAPVLDPIGSHVVAAGSTLALVLGSSDPNGDTPRYTASPLPLPGGASLDAVSGLFMFSPGLDEVGDHEITLQVDDGELSDSETITVTVEAPPPGSPTAVQGQIMDAVAANDGFLIPIAGVTVREINTGVEAISDADGNFYLEGLEAGEHTLFVDGSTAISAISYGSYRTTKHYELNVVTVLDRPIYLPHIDFAGTAIVDPAVSTTVDNPNIGVTLEVPPNSILTPEGDAYTGEISVSEVPAEFTPSSLPDFLEPSLVITMQPAGLVFDTPAQVTFANIEGFPPGNEVDIWSLDAERGVFFVSGVGRVSDDGSVIETISGGISEASWHVAAAPQPDGDFAGGGDNQSAGDEVRCGMASEVSVASACLKDTIEIPTYRSKGRERGLTLLYQSSTARPAFRRTMTLTIGTRSAVPPEMTFAASIGGSATLGAPQPVDTSVLPEDEDGTFATTLDLDATPYPTGVYDLTVEARSEFGSSSVATNVDTIAAVNNGTESVFGAGWSLTSLQRLHPPEDFVNPRVYITSGDGNGQVFRLESGTNMIATEGQITQRMHPRGALTTDAACGWIVLQPERIGVELTEPLPVDVIRPTTVASVADDAPGLIPAGTRVTTYLVQGHGMRNPRAATAVFERQVLGLQLRAGTLGASDDSLGVPDVEYIVADREMEHDRGDQLTLRSDRRTLELDLGSDVDTGTDRDHIRVVVESDGTDAFPIFFDDFDCHGRPEWVSTIGGPTEYGGLRVGEAGERGMDLDLQDFNVGAGQGLPARVETARDITLSPGRYYLSFTVENRGLEINGTSANEVVVEFAPGLGVGGRETMMFGPPGERLITRVIDVVAPWTGKLAFDASNNVDDDHGIVIDDVLITSELQWMAPDGDPTKLVLETDDTWTRINPDGTRIRFDAEGFQTSVEEYGGEVTSYDYDDDGRLTMITDSAGLDTVLAYGGDGYLDSITDPMERSTLFVHAPPPQGSHNLNLQSVTFPDDTSRQFFYDGHLLTGETDQRLQQKSRTYVGGGLNRLHRFESATFHGLDTDDDGDAIGDADDVTRRRDRSVGYGGGIRLDNGTVIPGEPVERLARDEISLRNVIITDGEGNETLFSTGQFDSLSAVTAPDGAVTVRDRDGDGNVLLDREPSGHTIHRTYDAKRNVLSEYDEVLGGTTEFTYHPQHNGVTAIRDSRYDPADTDPLQTTLHYDPSGNLERIVSPAGREVSFSHNADGTLNTFTDRFGTVTTWTYETDDALDGGRGNVQSMTSIGADGTESRTWTFTPGPHGEVGSVTDGLSRTVSFAHDAMGRVLTQTNADSSVVGFGYDPEGMLSSVTPPGKPAHELSYDQRDRLQSYTPPDIDGSDPSTTYGLNEETLGTVTLPDGRTVTYGYEAVGTNPSARLESVGIGRGDYLIAYDPTSGLVSEATAPDGSVLASGYEHPSADDPTVTVPSSLLTSQTWSGAVNGSVSWTFDPDGRLATRSVNGGDTVSYTYDNDGLLESVGTLSMTLDGDSGYVTATTQGVVTTSASPTAFGELDTFSATGTDLVYSADHDYDAAGQLWRKTEQHGALAEQVFEYGYDAQGRLETVTIDGALARTYSYDDNGNRLSLTEGAEVTAGVYDDQDRLMSYGDLSFTYNRTGQLETRTDNATGDQTSYVYDELGNLVSVTLPDNTLIEYDIDAQNRRVGKTVTPDGGTAQRQWGLLYGDQLNPVAELDGAGSLVSIFVYGQRPHVPDYMVRGGVTYRIVSDHLGSVRAVVDTVSGAVVQRIDYDEFGNVLSDSSPGFQPFGFAGGLYDADIGLVRFGARDYDPVVGRWTAKDPIGFEGSAANLYLYVGGSPLNYVDSGGLEAVTAAALTIAGAAAVGAATGFASALGKELGGDGPVDWGNVLGATALGAGTGVLTGTTVALGVLGGAGLFSAAQIAAASGLIGTAAFAADAAKGGLGAAGAGLVCKLLGGGLACVPAKEAGKGLQKSLCE